MTPATFCSFVLLATALPLLAVGCQSKPAAAPALAVAIPVPPVGADQVVNLPGLHNVLTYAPDRIGGGQPEGQEGLATLAAMGIKTIVSVDGQKPDAELAQQLGMRYVHLPISYDTVTPQRQQELAQVLANCEGPIYMHCHHGKHRSAAALGSALVLCGTLTPEQAQQRMKVSGTAKEYTGLWQAVATGKPLSAEQLRADPKSFPSVATVTGMVATMAGIDAVFDLVKQSEKAGWKAPDDHPDLIATKETARLALLFAELQHDGESKALPADYQQQLQKAIEQSRALDAAVRRADTKQAAELLAALGKGCKSCHVTYRDQ